MSDSVYMVVTVLGEGGQGSRGGSIAIFARTPPSRGRPAGHGPSLWGARQWQACDAVVAA